MIVPATGRARGDRERGGTLIFLLIFSILLAGFATSFLSRGLRENRAGAGYRELARSRFAAEGLLARAEILLRSGDVDPEGRNLVVEAALSTGVIRRLADSTQAMNEINGRDYRLLYAAQEGSVWISRLTSELVRLEAEATVGLETSYVSETLRPSVPVTWLQRSVSGVGLHPSDQLLGWGIDPFGGGDVLLVNPPPALLDDHDAEERRKDFSDLSAPDPDSVVTLPGPALYEIPMPDDRIWGDLRVRAGAGYMFLSEDGYIVELLGPSIRISEYDKDPKKVEKTAITLPVPAEGVVYFRSDILSIQGTVVGRMTIATEGTVHVTGNLQYLDEDGNLAMLGGISGGPEFDANPDYGGDSVLGVVARGNIFYSPAMETLSELDAAFFSQTGTVGLQMLWYDSAVGLNESGFGVPIYFDQYAIRGKESLKELGAKISAGLPCSRVEGTDLGFAQTISLYDPNLRIRPPPGFPSLPISLRTVTRRVGGVAGLDGSSRRVVTRGSAAMLPRSADPVRFEAVKAIVQERYPAFGVRVKE